MSTRTIRIIQLAILLLPYILIAVLWGRIPDPMPLNWISGKLQPKMWHVFDNMMFPSTMLVLMVGTTFLSRRKNSHHIYLQNILVMVFMAFFTCDEVIRLFKMCSIINPHSNYTPLPFALFFILAGNFFTKMRPGVGGIRTPWALANERVWAKTHRMTGYLWVIGGIIMLASLFIPVIKDIEIIPEVLAGGLILVPVAYSYIIYRKEPQI